ncbi:hypothetical protein N7466_009791 [Penicillium verhagenii]|uniref:uncharacterized protein n=1 Tax=Penicillium verhagenii TaxID=1562060 RepID=UPI0025453691|nr:uncharacterized protein N7466_009791 [Penicillium verhagenii]KAJ5921465.1 hypothetical protein N7466_009791 [Penicillium verhagenii]
MIICQDEIRARFASALSEMYQREVPQYGTLLELVSNINQRHKGQGGQDIQHRIEVERHGAIRLGTPDELGTMRRLFLILGMEPVGYYDLSVAGLPVHATCFRPLTKESLSQNPFRVFTSLLRPEMIGDQQLRDHVEDILKARHIFSPRCLELMNEWEKAPFSSQALVDELINESLQTFRWHETTTVDRETYEALQAAHPLIADVVCFRGPHINHLTPRVADIDEAQLEMLRRGLQPKKVIEGPPAMRCPILLRQTSFLALEERISFSNWDEVDGKHKARFGEIEQRGMALTPKGRSLYDEITRPKRTLPKDSLVIDHCDCSIATFKDFPDDYSTIRREKLGYFTYHVSNVPSTPVETHDLDSLISAGIISFEPITYEDFLPISAAGIFQSNLGTGSFCSSEARSDKARFEASLGTPVLSEFDLYGEMERLSLVQAYGKLSIPFFGV